MGVPRATEWTVRDLLQEELRRRGVTVVPEVSFDTPFGRLMPDIVLKNGAEYVVETKLGTVADLLKAVIKLGDYKKYSGAKGAFAVLFPEQLRRPWDPEMLRSIALDPSLKYTVTYTFDDFRPSGSFEGNLPQISDWIAKQVLKALPIEVETSFAIRVLRGTVHYVGEMMRRLRDRELEDIFGGKTVFENILQYEAGKYPLEQMRQAATYLLINQLLFYHVLARVGIFEPIDEAEIKNPGDLAGYFGQVLEKDYSAVFGFDVASRLPVKATEMVRNVVKIIGVLSPEKIRHDLLGKVFHELIPFETRKAVAAFYTNNEAAEILAQLAIDKPDAKVMDLAVGSGTLLVAAYRRKRELLQKVKGTVELEDHKRFLEEDLTGIDIMPFAAHLAVVHLSLQTLLYETEKVRVAVWDSTELRPEETIPAIWSELKAAYRRPTLDMFAKEEALSKEAYVTKGAITLEGVGGERIPLETVDVVIMNPPFTRQQRIPRDYKQVLAKRFTDHSQYVHGQMGYHGYFLLLANRFLKNGGRLALVLPASVLNADGFQKIREFLTNYYRVEHIVTTWQRSAFSEGAQFREILLIAKKRESGASEDSICAISELKRLPHNLKEAKESAEKIKNTVRTKGHGIVFDDESMQVSLFTMKELRNSVDNLFKFIAFTDKKLMDVRQSIADYAKDRLVGLGEYINQHGSGPKEGAALGQILKGGGIGAFYIHRDPDKMIKKRDVWLLREVEKNQVAVEHKILHKTFNVPLNALRCAVRRFSGLDTFDISDQLDYIIADIFPDVENFLSLSLGKKVSHNRLKKWNRYVDNLLGNLLFVNHADVSASGTSMVAYYSPKSTVVPRSMWSMKVPDAPAKVLTLWLNSTLNLLQILLLRRETRGAYLWFVASTIREFLIPNIDKIPQNEITVLLQIFDEYCNERFPSLLDQLKVRFPARVAIDKALLRVLGFGDDEIDRILDYLYPALANEIEQLKTLMQG